MKIFIKTIQTKAKALVALYALALVLIYAISASSAHAVTVDGNEYQEILSVFTHDDLGFWANSDKFYTFINNDNYLKPNRIHAVKSNETGLARSGFKGALLMGFTEPNESDLKSASFELLGKNNEVLLSANYVSNGHLETIRKRGSRGQLDIDGVFNVNGGSLFEAGVISEQIYLTVAFDFVWQNEYKDFKTRRGTYTLFDYAGGVNPPNPEPPIEEVPEPLTAGLLLSGLIGAARIRAKK